MQKCCCICNQNYTYPMSFKCGRHIACASCIFEMLNANISYDFNLNQLIHTRIKCPICREQCGRLSIYNYVKGFSRNCGIYPIPDDCYDTIYGDTINQCIFCEYTGSVKEVCNHMVYKCESISISCPLCKHKVLLKNITSGIHMHTECTMRACGYCGKAIDANRIKHHENIHTYSMKLQSQLYKMAGEVKCMSINDNTSEQIKMITDLLKYNKNSIKRILQA